jgi:hypothetical protein
VFAEEDGAVLGYCCFFLHAHITFCLPLREC